MLNIDQVRQLENRVDKAVRKITSLSDENRRLADENKTLQDQLFSFQTRVNELERSVQEFQEDQGRIEEGILNALDKLSSFEDSVLSGDSADMENGESGNDSFDGNPENQNGGQMDIF